VPPEGPGRDFWRLGNHLFEKSEFENAARAYGQAIQLEPDEADYRFNRALCSLMLREYDGALEDLQWAMGVQPRRADIRFLLGEVRSAKGETALARNDYQAALRLATRLTLGVERASPKRSCVGRPPRLRDVNGGAWSGGVLSSPLASRAR
jgi:tetratricopeptide (TPR) repeat protein